MDMGNGFFSGETRSATCKRCGKGFVQQKLSDRFIETACRVAAREGKETPALLREIPDCFVPLHCPPCERQAMTEEYFARRPYELEAIRRATADHLPPEPGDAHRRPSFGYDVAAD